MVTKSTTTGGSGHGVSESDASQRRPVSNAVFVWLVCSAFSFAIAAIESVFSNRGLALVGLLLALVITLCTGWLRPPLSRDLGSFELSLVSCTSKTPLQTGPRFRLDSPGALMFVVLCAGFMATAHASQRTALAGGLVLSGGLLANTAAVLNQPVLIESLQLEHQERQQMAIVLQHISGGDAVTKLSNGRVPYPPNEVIECGSSLHGWNYLLHGKWLVLVGLTIYLFTSSCRLRSRLLGAGAWILVGAILSCVLCSQRLIAEHCWSQSEEFAAAADYERAREAFTHALHVCPALEELERTWYWAGKLDYLERKSTSRAMFFRAAQLANDRQHHQAAMLMDELLARTEGDCVPVRGQAARSLTALGLMHYLDGSTYDLPQTAESRGRLRSTEAAVAFWSRALTIQPNRATCLLFRSVALAGSSNATAQVEEDVQQFLMATADRSLQADILATLGDVYFEAGQTQRARQYYEQSKRIFELPKDINFRARRGLLGV